jgi:hypothetical protein
MIRLARLAPPRPFGRWLFKYTGMPAEKISVFLADDNLIVREGVRALMPAHPLSTWWAQ